MIFQPRPEFIQAGKILSPLPRSCSHIFRSPQLHTEDTLGDYFKNLYMLDPLFHAIVNAKLREIQKLDASTRVTVNNLAETDELDILREYSVTLYKEYRTLRTVFLENMVVTNRSVGMKYNPN